MNQPSSPRSRLVTNAPEVVDPPALVPTGNLWVSLADIDAEHASVGSLGVLLERSLGLVEASPGGDESLIRPWLTVDGETVPLAALTWRRHAHWLPVFTSAGPSGELEGRICPPIDDGGGERGVALRLTYRNDGTEPVRVELGWSGRWDSTSVTHLRTKPVDGRLQGHDDPWTGSRVVTFMAGLPLLSIAWHGGEGLQVTAPSGPGDPGVETPGWHAGLGAQVGRGESVVADLYVGVATEPDGAATTALHLHRRGFVELWETATRWLDQRALPVTHGQEAPSTTVDPDRLSQRINTNLFFNYFFAQGDCLDTGRPVLVTSRSRRYYVAAAFWSRDAFSWTFPALLLTDPGRSRQVLVSALEAIGPRAADHALYLNGTSLYPGFELDQAAAPVLAVWRYVEATGDTSILQTPAVADLLGGLESRVQPWRHPSWDLYATFLLPTDDPTDFPFVTTANALLAAAFDAAAGLIERSGGPGHSAHPYRILARAIRAALLERLTVDSPHGRMWVWACDLDGRAEYRDEPPLSLRSLPYWGVSHPDDPVHIATRAWLDLENPHHYRGPFPGTGASHFPHPSGFDLANRLLDSDPVDGDPLGQLATLPLDNGLACESWDVDTGIVRTGAGMASMAGLLAWAAWDNLSGTTRWDGQTVHP